VAFTLPLKSGGFFGSAKIGGKQIRLARRDLARQVLAAARGALRLLAFRTFLACAPERLVTLRIVFVRSRHGGSEIGFKFIEGRA